MDAYTHVHMQGTSRACASPDSIITIIILHRANVSS